MDLGWQIAQLRPEIDAAIAECIDNTAFIQGARVAAFEHAYAQYAQAGYAIGCGSGTDALYLALIATGVSPGQKVILPTMTFFATIEAVKMIGAEPVLVDIDEETSTMDVNAVENALDGRTGAILPVLLYGRAARMDVLAKMANARGIPLIADGAQAQGATFNGEPVGRFTAVTCYSFYPGKNLGAFGDAGGCTTDDPTLAQDMRMRRDHGRSSKYEHTFYGVNMRMDEIQAAVLQVKLARLHAWTERRTQLAHRYDAELRGLGDLVLPSLTANGGSVWHLYVVQTERREALQGALKQADVQTGVHYPIPLHLQPACADLRYPRGAFPVAERQASRILSLPMYEGMTDAQQERVVAAVRKFYG
jgi:dTDP-4-amino-4,6-dideoxygalactose transaminase